MLWAAILLLASGTGENPPPSTLFGHPVREVQPLSPAEIEARRADFQSMLDDRGWVQIGDQVRPMAPDGGFTQPNAPQGEWTFPPHRATIFLNFFGATLESGTNAALDESSCINGEVDWPGFAGTEQQALALIQVFETQMAPYGVRIAFEERPPAHLPYAMVMMGGTPQMLGLGSGVLGVSCSSDCGDRWWRDTTFAFTANINPNNAETLGTTALHEAAHAFGLAHIGDSTKIMNPFVGSADVTWGDVCTPFDSATGGINCTPTHGEFCEGGTGQDSAAELLAYFGPNSPDTVPPTVTITSPADGAELEVGGSVTVEADIEDDHDGAGWKLVIVEVGQEEVAYTFDKQWELGNLPQGVFTIRVEAIDHERNEGSDEVTIYVGQEAPGDTGDGGVGTSEGDDGTTSDDAGTVGAGDDGGDKGCGCTTQPGPVPWAAWSLVFGGLLVARRRRGA